MFIYQRVILKKDNAAGCRSVPCTMVQTRKRHNWFGNWVDRRRIVCCSNLLLLMKKTIPTSDVFFFRIHDWPWSLQSNSNWHVVERKSHRLFHPDLSPCMVSFPPLTPRLLYIYTHTLSLGKYTSRIDIIPVLWLNNVELIQFFYDSVPVCLLDLYGLKVLTSRVSLVQILTMQNTNQTHRFEMSQTPNKLRNLESPINCRFNC